MSPKRFDELLSNYRSMKARYAYLNSQIVMLERYLAICEGEMIEDKVSMSQAITGMPHGTTVGDPTGRLAMDIASGEVSVFVKQIREDMERIKAEIGKIEPEMKVIEIALQALGERELAVMEMRMMDDMSWPEVMFSMNKRYGNVYAKRTLQRLLDRAKEKAYEAIK